MGVKANLEHLVGEWIGVSGMRFMATDDFTESVSSARVSVTAAHLITVSYTWSNEDGPQDGMLLIGDGSAPQEAVAVWVDSFHQSPRWMAMQGVISTEGIALEGVYPAPPGPDWGWRIHIGGPDLRIAMINVPAGEAAYEVVRAAYTR